MGGKKGFDVSHFTKTARQRAVEIFKVGVAAADPAAAVTRALEGLPKPDLVIAVGKAALAMARAAQGVFGPSETLVVTNDENAGDLAGASVWLAGHPVPDERGAVAAKAILARLSRMAKGQVVLALISGGGSALLPAPVAGLTLADKAEVNRLLLASGAEITAMNLVRQQLSSLKGGGLLRAAYPARVRALILSDVVGDDLRAIASGPTVAPLGNRAEARAILNRYGLWPALPASVRRHLDQPEGPDAPLPPADNLLIGSNALSVAAMAASAPEARIDAAPLVGDVADAARRVIAAGRGTTLFGGETTVVLKGKGRGGRNQELALRVALLAEEAGWAGPWVFLSGGTDGRDGPTDAAGAIVDEQSLDRMRAAGFDPLEQLARNDSYPCLAASGDLLMTGGTGTNVADLQVLIRP
jgi:glycerate 2-kinase